MFRNWLILIVNNIDLEFSRLDAYSSCVRRPRHQYLIHVVEERSIKLTAYGVTCRPKLVRTLTRCRADHECCSKLVRSLTGRVHPAAQCEIRRRTNRLECSRSRGRHDLMIPHVRSTCGDALDPILILTGASGVRGRIVSTIFIIIRPYLLIGVWMTPDDVCPGRTGGEYISGQRANAGAADDLEIFDWSGITRGDTLCSHQVITLAWCGIDRNQCTITFHWVELAVIDPTGKQRISGVAREDFVEGELNGHLLDTSCWSCVNNLANSMKHSKF